jgi:hypothetical protein
VVLAHQHAHPDRRHRRARKVTLSGDGLQVNGGWMRSSQIRCGGSGLPSTPAGKELVEAIADADATGFSIDGHRLAWVPRDYRRSPAGWATAHRTLTAEQGWPADGWLATRRRWIGYGPVGARSTR